MLGVSAADDIGYLSDYIASNIMLETEESRICLKRLTPKSGWKSCWLCWRGGFNPLMVEQKIHQKVHEQINQNQKEYYLREQLKIINQELRQLRGPAGRGFRVPQTNQKLS